MNRLFVIGNGFDLHHGIPSRYSDFGEYIQSVDHYTHRLLRDYLFVDKDFWNCFEERLASFDADNVIEHAENYLVSYGADDWSESGHHDFEYEIEQIVEGIATKTRRHFADWVRQLPIPRPGDIPPLHCIDPTARYLSFNYTPTLQTLYAVPDSNVLHIHGMALDDRSEIVLGHGWMPDARQKLTSQVNEDTDTRVAGGYELIDDYFVKTFKPTDKIITENLLFFNALSSVDEVWVLGHSLSEVDGTYFESIAANVGDSAKWVVSYHDDRADAADRFAALGLSVGLVEFARLAVL